MGGRKFALEFLGIQAAADDERQVSESFSIAFKEIEVVYTPKLGANAKSGACTYIDHYE